MGPIIHAQPSIAGHLARVIGAVHAVTGERILVLVDRCEKPIVDNLGEPDTARTMRDGLRNLDRAASCAAPPPGSWPGHALQSVEERGSADQRRTARRSSVCLA